MEDPQNTYDPYNIEDVDGGKKSSTTDNNQGDPPAINRVKNPEEENCFLRALAQMHKVDPSEITHKTEGYWKIYMINGHQIFKDRA